MIIDDSPSVLNVCRDMLTRLGYEIIRELDTIHGILDEVEAHRPEIILMDVDLKEKRDGIDAASTISKHFSIPIIIMTGLDKSALVQNDQLEKLGRSGAFAFLQKPLTELALDQTIRLALAKQGSHQREKLEDLADRLPYVLIKTPKEFQRINIKDILYIKGGHNYCDIVCVEKKYTSRNTLKDLQSRMGELLFQIHKGTLVNLLHICKLDTDFSTLVTTDNTQHPVGSSFRKALKDRLELL